MLFFKFFGRMSYARMYPFHHFLQLSCALSLRLLSAKSVEFVAILSKALQVSHLSFFCSGFHEC